MAKTGFIGVRVEPETEQELTGLTLMQIKINNKLLNKSQIVRRVFELGIKALKAETKKSTNENLTDSQLVD